MSSRPALVPSTGRTARRALLVAFQLALAAAAAPAARAQDTASAKPVVPAPKDTGKTRDTVAATKDTAVVVPRPARDSVAAPRDSAALTPALKTAAVPASTTPTVTPAGTPAEAELANGYVQRAVSLYEAGRDDEAIAEYRRGIKNDPLDSDTWYGLAELLHELGRDKQAMETYALSLQAIEHAPELRIPYAELLMANHRKAEAIKVLNRGIELDPEAADEMKKLLGNVLVGALDETVGDSTVAAKGATTAAAPAATGSATPAPPVSTARPSASAPAKPRPKIDRTKRKKLCKLFCPGTFDPMAPKPE